MATIATLINNNFPLLQLQKKKYEFDEQVLKYEKK